MQTSNATKLDRELSDSLRRFQSDMRYEVERLSKDREVSELELANAIEFVGRYTYYTLGEFKDLMVACMRELEDKKT